MVSNLIQCSQPQNVTQAFREELAFEERVGFVWLRKGLREISAWLTMQSMETQMFLLFYKYVTRGGRFREMSCLWFATKILHYAIPCGSLRNFTSSILFL